MFNIVYINPGDKLWYIVRGHKYPGDIIVPVIANEIDEIYTHPVDPKIGSCWSHRFIDSSQDYVSVPTSSKDENGWPIFEHKEPSWLKENNMKPCNQFVWIDEPVGHAIQVGDPYDGLFLTLNEARKYATPSKKRHLRRRLNYSRTRHHKFIASTWKNNGETHPGFDKLPEKKIYVVKKK